MPHRPSPTVVEPAQPAAAGVAEAALAQAARDELHSVLGSPAFAGAMAHQRLLRHLVERALAGEGDTLKETVIAIEVFQRPAGRFDPKSDSIVRVEARRLRERLRQHYDTQGLPAARLRIDLPKGSYRPRFVTGGDVAATPAAELVDRGQYFLRQGHEDGHRKALARFEEAALLAPGLAAAHSGVARAWVQLVSTNLEPPLPGVELALAAVQRALALQPGHVDSLVLAAQLTHRFAFDWPGAQALFAQARRAAPASPYVEHALAFSLMMRGAFDEAQALLADARLRDPLHLTLRAHEGLLHLYRRDWDAAEAALRALLDMVPHNVLATSLQATVALLRGQPERALPMFNEVAARHPGLSIGAIGRAQVLAVSGRADEARETLHRLSRDWQGRYLSPYQLAMVHERLGERDEALSAMARSIAERDPNALTLPVDPTFDALRADPAGAALVRQVMNGPLRPVPAKGAAATPAAPTP